MQTHSSGGRYSDDEVGLSGLQGSFSFDVECGSMDDGERGCSQWAPAGYKSIILATRIITPIYLTFTHVSTLYNSRSRGMLFLRCCGCISIEE